MTNIFIEKQKCMGVPEHLKNKIKWAALARNMTMIAYLDSIVPDIKMEEGKCQK